jgi:hypothetical protein
MENGAMEGHALKHVFIFRSDAPESRADLITQRGERLTLARSQRVNETSSVVSWRPRCCLSSW